MRANHLVVLLPLAVAGVLFALGFVAVAWTARVAMKRLALEPWNVLLWFGLAEAPVDELAAKRGRASAASGRLLSRA